MKKLNNKGMTIVEMLVCFMIVAFISTALFSTATVFNNKRSIESAKAQLLAYRNQIDKLIEDDLINKGLTNVMIKEKSLGDTGSEQYVVMFFKDGSKKVLIIHSKTTGEYGTSDCSGSDEYYIKYGTVPDTTDHENIDTLNGLDIDKYTLPDTGKVEEGSCTFLDSRFNTIDVSNESYVSHIYINFYHPELGNNYSINIVAPINYFA